MPDATRPLRNLVLGGEGLDRDALVRSTPGLLPGLLAAPTTRVLELRGTRAPMAGGHLLWRTPNEDDRAWYAGGGLVLYLGRLRDVQAVAVLRPDADAPASEPAEGSAPPEHQWTTLRESGLDLDAADVACLTSAVALTQWHATHGHCPRCGSPTVPREAGWVRLCEQDGSQHFPRTDPAVIMAVIDAPADGEERILLARGARWDGPHRSVLAGFVEPGESFEQAVARETFEESGVSVRDVTYLGSQPWPFPASIMVGATARATSTHLRPQEGEIEEIAWYSRGAIARGVADGTLRLPGRLSIANALIEHWYGEPLPTRGTEEHRFGAPALPDDAAQNSPANPTPAKD